MEPAARDEQRRIGADAGDEPRGASAVPSLAWAKAVNAEAAQTNVIVVTSFFTELIFLSVLRPFRCQEDNVPRFRPTKCRTCWVMAISLGSRSMELAP